jgi:hypothetical protein
MLAVRATLLFDPQLEAAAIVNSLRRFHYRDVFSVFAASVQQATIENNSRQYGARRLRYIDRPGRF